MQINQDVVDEAFLAHRAYQHHQHRAKALKAEAEDKFAIIGRVALGALNINCGNNTPVVRQVHVKIGKAIAPMLGC